MLRVRIFATLLLMFFAAPSWAAPTAPTVYVSWDGTGDYNCDGTNDEVEINAALTYITSHSGFTTVYLKGPHTYVIDGTIRIGSNTTLTGASGVVVKLVDHANWSTGIPMVTATSSSGIHDVAIHGFEINGNDANNTDYDAAEGKTRYNGHNWYNIFSFSGVTRLNIYNMYLHHNMNDALKTSNCSYVNYYNNRIIRCGHDGLYAYKTTYVNAYGNTIGTRTNSGIRFSESNYCKAYDNYIYKEYGGGAGFEIQRDSSNTVDNIEIYNNVVNGTAGAGVWLFGEASTTYAPAKARNVKIYNNIFYNCAGGVQTSGFYDTYIENNVIDNCGSAIYIYANPSFPAPAPYSGYKYNTFVRNNIMVGNSYGIRNRHESTHTVNSMYNCFHLNTTNISGGAITSANELLNVDPLFYNRSGRDYHLKSKYGRWDPVAKNWAYNDAAGSPCIDAGYWLSKYNNEPRPNGWRINIGAYGNTPQASKSLFTAINNSWRYWE